MTEQAAPETAGHELRKLKETIAGVLESAKQHGASQAEASANTASGLSVGTRMREVETLEFHRDQGLTVTVYFGQRKGSASTSDLRTEYLSETVAKACSLARFAAEDDCAGLADAARMARDVADPGLSHPWPIEAPQAIDLALECEAAALDTDPRINNSEGAALSTHHGFSVYGNSHGFLEGYADTEHSLSCAVLASDGQEMQRDFEYSV
ncbi:MAG: PmbA/TldA family metallopeptidase, partial [Gammaproteobacteria bacterium]